MKESVERIVGRDGRRKIVFRGRFEPEFVDELRKGGVDDLIFASGSWDDFQWVADSGVSVSRISVIDPFENYREIDRIEGLRDLSIQGRLKGVDVGGLKSLSALEVDWSSALRGKISGLKDLRSLKLVYFGETNAEEIGGIDSLRALDLRQGSIRSLAGLERCRDLDHLELVLLSKLEDASAVGILSRLKVLRIEKCSKLVNVDFIDSLHDLEDLHIECGCKEIHGVTLFRRMSKLKRLLVGAQIRDIDWRELLALPKLERCLVDVPADQVPDELAIARIATEVGRKLIDFKISGTKKRPWVGCELEPPATVH